MGKKGYTTFQWAIIVIGAILCFLPKYFISFEGLSVSGVQVLFILIGGIDGNPSEKGRTAGRYASQQRQNQ